MNPFEDQLAASLTEIDDWCANSPDAGRCPSEFYAVLKTLISNARTVEQLNRDREPMSVILQLLVDSGPYDTEFAPSLHRVIDEVTNRPSRHWDA